MSKKNNNRISVLYDGDFVGVTTIPIVQKIAGSLYANSRKVTMDNVRLIEDYLAHLKKCINGISHSREICNQSLPDMLTTRIDILSIDIFGVGWANPTSLMMDKPFRWINDIENERMIMKVCYET